MKGQIDNFKKEVWNKMDKKVDWSLRRKFWRMSTDHWRVEKVYLIKEDLMVQDKDLESKNLVASYLGHFIVAF